MMTTTVVLEGLPGAGKSTLLRMVAERLRELRISTAVVDEPVDEWVDVGILQRFCDAQRGVGPGSYSDIVLLFQMFAGMTRAAEARRTMAANDGVAVVLSERSRYSDRLFFDLQRVAVGEAGGRMYDAWSAFWGSVEPPALCATGRTKVVYLKPSIDACMARAAARARDGETISREYYEQLEAAHDVFLGQRPGTPAPAGLPWGADDVLVVEGAMADANFVACDQAGAAIVEHVVSRIVGRLATA